jgi:hypothetical protein
LSKKYLFIHLFFNRYKYAQFQLPWNVNHFLLIATPVKNFQITRIHPYPPCKRFFTVHTCTERLRYAHSFEFIKHVNVTDFVTITPKQGDSARAFVWNRSGFHTINNKSSDRIKYLINVSVHEVGHFHDV